MKSSRGAKIVIITAAIALVIDIISKQLISRYVFQSESLPLLGDYFRITHVKNAGAAFGFFPGNRAVLIAFSILAMLFLGLLIMRSRKRSCLSLFSVGLVLGGAFGNLLDRIRSGRVVDFIDVGFGTHRWPVFNFADVWVTVGVVILAVSLYSGGHEAADGRSETESLA